METEGARRIFSRSGGRGKLTKAMIDRLQNYYGIAIRQNPNDLPGMKNAVRATLFHVASSKDQNYHTAYCPAGKDSWCRYQRDKATGNNTFKHGPGLPVSVIAHVKPIFQDLSSDSLFKECLHGKTQNHNESFNGTIWERLPKIRFVTLTRLKFGIFDAAANFNIGRKANILIFEKMGMIPGNYTLKGSRNINRKRLFHSVYKDKKQSKKRRKVIRGKKNQRRTRIRRMKGLCTKQENFNSAFILYYVYL